MFCTCVTIRQLLKDKTKLKFFVVMEVPTLLYGSIIWSRLENNVSIIKTSEMKLLRAVRDVVWGIILEWENKQRIQDFQLIELRNIAGLESCIIGGR